MIYITGDKHRRFAGLIKFCELAETSRGDILIQLGDAGINYFGARRDAAVKRRLAALPITLFCVHGNHEKRPETIPTYREEQWHGGTVYVEPEYPSLLFAKDGEVYEFAGKRCLVIGGAYSVDKPFRLANNLEWWPDELPSEEIKQRVEQRLDQENRRIDIVLSHTSPFKYIPREKFLAGVEQDTVDYSTEAWLDEIEEKLTYDRWYCGHYHTNKIIDKMRFLFEDYLEFR
ncbi:MAG: metallophosphoesterase [Clostridiales bacterium]|nr:metallophosphoesterase [Clostridiales bacterium]